MAKNASLEMRSLGKEKPDVENRPNNSGSCIQVYHKTINYRTEI